MSAVSAEELSQFLLIPENGAKSQVAQLAHRLELLSAWGGIRSGDRVLELGCGQGDCTIVLAHAVGATGAVVAVDPAPEGYGAPYTVKDAQRHISTTALGARITWVEAYPLEFLPASAPEPEYDVGVLAHSLWYFSSPAVVTATLQGLRTLCKRIYIAEWAQSASSAAAYPHVLAALTQAALECRKPSSVSNVRTVLSPAAITQLAVGAGWKLASQGVVVPKAGMNDGKWEAYAVSDEEFLREVEEYVKDEREKAVVVALRDSTLRSVDNLEGGLKAVLSMDAWCGVFETA